MKVRLEMAPMASVSGHVIGADGRPAAHAHVLAAEIAYQNGVKVLNQVQGVETDERGNYRLFWLPPGKYVHRRFSRRNPTPADRSSVWSTGRIRVRDSILFAATHPV